MSDYTFIATWTGIAFALYFFEGHVLAAILAS
jgi:hypothetical protein